MHYQEHASYIDTTVWKLTQPAGFHSDHGKSKHVKIQSAWIYISYPHKFSALCTQTPNGHRKAAWGPHPALPQPGAQPPSTAPAAAGPAPKHRETEQTHPNTPWEDGFSGGCRANLVLRGKRIIQLPEDRIFQPQVELWCSVCVEPQCTELQSVRLVNTGA